MTWSPGQLVRHIDDPAKIGTVTDQTRVRASGSQYRVNWNGRLDWHYEEELIAADAGTTTVSGTAEAQRFSALSDAARGLLVPDAITGGVPGIASDLGLAASTLADTKADNRTSRAALQGSLDGIETISAEDVTAQLLQLQTQLQASYQVTSMLSKLTLVNYLS